MPYTVKQLADLAGVSVRMLHHYDQIGLLRPERAAGNGYRRYGESELLQLQQILFFRELDFPLREIRRILSSPHFDPREALRDQRKMIELKKKRLGQLTKTIDKTIKKINRETTMEDEELYGSFTKGEMEKYAEEARRKWGDTEAYRQSRERIKKMGKNGLKQALEESGEIIREIVLRMASGPTSAEVQRLIARHYDSLRHFYEPTLEIYRGLAEMYVADARFKAFYEKIAHGLARFMRDAMIAYCGSQEGGGKK